MTGFVAEHWLTILGSAAVAWSLFQLGKLWERDHPQGGFSFTPDESWGEPKIPTRRGIYDFEQES